MLDTKFEVKINPEILSKYPNTQIGYVVVKINNPKNHPYTDSLKQVLLQEFIKQNPEVNLKSITEYGPVKQWREIFQTFGVNSNKYRSSVEALTRRVLESAKTGRLWNISSIVDAYNAYSVLSGFPMGGYDIKKIQGQAIELRFANQAVTERFLGIGAKEAVETAPEHVVYSDAQQIICWLWNHKDSMETCISEETKEAIFFIDSCYDPALNSKLNACNLQQALDEFQAHLIKLGCMPVESGILDASQTCKQITFPQDFYEPLPDAPYHESFNNLYQPSMIEVSEKKTETHYGKFFQYQSPIEELAKNKLFFEHACAIGDLQLVKALIQCDSSLINFADTHGTTAFYQAVFNKRHAVVKLLFSQEGFSVLKQANPFDGNTPLHRAILNEDASMVRLLLDQGAENDQLNHKGYTARELLDGNPYLDHWVTNVIGRN